MLHLKIIIVILLISYFIAIVFSILSLFFVLKKQYLQNSKKKLDCSINNNFNSYNRVNYNVYFTSLMFIFEYTTLKITT